MNLKPRLRAIARLVEAGSSLVDIGTDHACLPVYLIKNGICRQVTGVEKNQACLERARHNVARFNLQEQIVLRQGDGFDPVRDHEQPEGAVIAGLGGHTICKIIKEGRDVAERLQYIILQPMRDAVLLRRWLAAHNMRLADECLVAEKNRIYVIMVVKPGRQLVSDPFLLEVGPMLMANRDPLLRPFLQGKIEHCRRIIKNLEQAEKGKKNKMQEYYRNKEKRLKEVLEYVSFREENG